MKILKRKKFTILKGIITYSFLLTFVFSFLIAIVAIPVSADKDSGAGLAPATTDSEAGLGITTTIKNPLGEGHLSTIPDFIEAILNIVINIGVPIVTLAIIYAGFLFVQAQGNPEKLEKAKKTLLYTLIGAVLLLGAWVLANAIGSTVNDITSTT